MSNLYLVQRRTWYGEWSVYEDSDYIEGGGVAVAAFTNRKDAVAHAATLEHGVWSEMSSPFRMVKDEVYDYRLGMDEEQFCEAIRDLGLEPPEPVPIPYGTERPWANWYDGIVDELTPRQLAGIADLFKKVFQVYVVVEVPVED